MLIIFGGLPGTGKTTIARALAQTIKAVHLRIDTIEEALISSGTVKDDIGPAGYMVAYDLAKDNLRLGHIVIADSVNPIEITRSAWRSVARDAGSRFLEIETRCSDPKEHQDRVENRQYGVRSVKWQQVLDREYEPWKSVSLSLDTAFKSPEECVTDIVGSIIGTGELVDKGIV